MACKIERPAPQVLFDRYKQLFSTTVLGGATVVPESNEWYAVAVNYAIGEEFYAITEQAWKSRDPREACCSDLINMASMDGFYPRPAIAAQGYLRLTGGPATPLPLSLGFVVGGQEFVSVSSPDRIGDDGTVVVRVRAVTPGSSGNASADTGSLQPPVEGVDETVEVCGGTFCQGQDAEDCEAFRARYLRRLQYNPRATNQWIMDKLLEWPCSTRALQRGGSCCQCNGCGSNSNCEDCGCKDCGGKMEFYLMFDNTFECGIAPADLLEEAQTWLFGSPQGYGLGQVEIGVCGRIVPVKPVAVDISIDVADCLTATQTNEIRDTIREFFGTLIPSQIVRAMAIQSIIASVIGISADVSARFELVNPEDGWGPGTQNPHQGPDSKVYFAGCDLEPECDFLPCLRDIRITTTATLGQC